MISTTRGRRPGTRAACAARRVCPRWMSGAVGSMPELDAQRAALLGASCELRRERARRAGCRPRCAASRAACLGGRVRGVRHRGAMLDSRRARRVPPRRRTSRLAADAARRMRPSRSSRRARRSTPTDERRRPPRHSAAGRSRRRKPRLKRLRFAGDPRSPSLLLGLDLVRLRDVHRRRLRPAGARQASPQFKDAQNSVLLDDLGPAARRPQPAEPRDPRSPDRSRRSSRRR